MLKTLGGAALAAALAAAAPKDAGAVGLPDLFSSFWVLGDSLSDNGNLYALTTAPGSPLPPMPPSPPYFEGRFSNGPVWNEPILAAFEAAGGQGGNFAFGGATALDGGQVPSLSDQLDLFLALPGEALGDRPLVSLWFGANDIFQAVAGPDPEAAALAAADAMGDAIDSLGAAGVDDLLLFTLPDLALTPRYDLFATDLADAARAATLAFNERLLSRIAAAEGELAIETVDIFALFDALKAEPAAFGVANATIPCFVPGLLGPCSEAEQDALAFFDPVHPNRVIHGEIAERVDAAFTAVPLPATAPLLLAALALAGLARRRAG